MPLYAVDLGVSGLTDVGVTEYDDQKNVEVARTQTGVTELGTTGIYWREWTLDVDTAALYWNSAAEDPTAFALGSASSRDLDTVDTVVDTIISVLGTPADTDLATDIANLVTSAITGAHPITVTVTDGTNPLEGAIVRVTEGANNEAKETDASGNASFTLDPATWTVRVTKDGYAGLSTTRTVTGDQAGTLTDDLELTAVVIPAAPADPGACTVYGYLKKADGTAAANVNIDITLVASSGAAKTDMLIVFDTITITTDANGDVTPTDFERQDFITTNTGGSFYQVTCEELGWQNKRMTLNAATYDLADLVG